jgi:hypothetical protein
VPRGVLEDSHRINRVKPRTNQSLSQRHNIGHDELRLTWSLDQSENISLENQSKGNLGAFLGIFTPTILTILGVIMYLRFGWVVGHLGLHQTLLVVVFANSITLVTTLSFSSMATNMKVGGGGAYFIISRSLGLGVGAAIGIPLFLSQAISVTLYAYGLAESLRVVWSEAPLLPLSIAVILLVSVISLYGAKFALKTQIPMLVLLLLSLWGRC